MSKEIFSKKVEAAFVECYLCGYTCYTWNCTKKETDSKESTFMLKLEKSLHAGEEVPREGRG